MVRPGIVSIVFLSLLVLPLLLLRPAHADIAVTTAETGLSGTTNTHPGGEVRIFHIGLLAGGAEDLNSISLKIKDLSPGTGLTQGDFSFLKLYRSADVVLDGGGC